jgi:molybdopterin/thiamine biosynthesis adenylyltransferase/rhodanese-related sulfurtransferase
MVSAPNMEAPVYEAEHAQREGALLFDIRESHERVAGTPAGALPAGADLAGGLAGHGVGPDTTFYLLCAVGERSLELAQRLRAAGYRNATSVKGGFAAWLQADLPTRFPGGFSRVRAERYARHLVLPQIGPEGQQALLNSAVLIIGAGGLGSPAALYLAAAGVGRIGIVDDDQVEMSNLQRQVLHDDASVGEPKASSARRRLAALNPDIRIEAMPVRLQAANVEEILPGWDVIVDGSDNFPTRYLVNDACVKLGKPLVYGAIMQFAGQVSVFWPAGAPGMNPCYRCLFPEPPGAEQAPNCATAGVLGVLPGVFGALQATEALKLLLGIGNSLTGRLLRVDALEMQFIESRLRADPDCRLCAPGAEFPGYPDYEAFCRA